MEYIQQDSEGLIDHSTYGKSSSKSIQILKQFGFKPIAITVMMFEETFVFETEEEALIAHDEFENNPTHNIVIQGWWYDREGFKKSVEKYIEKFQSIPVIYWLYDNKRYANGEKITAERIEDESWYYNLYQPFLEFMMSFNQRRDVSVEEIYEGFIEFLKSNFDFIPNEHDDAKILRWSVLHCERHNSMPTFEEIEEHFKKNKK